MSSQKKKAKGPLTPEVLERAARTLRLLAHPQRLAIIEILEDKKDGMPVHALTAQLGTAQAAVSQHLGTMQRAGLLYGERRGQEVWYRIDDARCLTILGCMRKGAKKQ
jgi:DNA-binding transcriptional ArsR family regulator